MLLLSLFENTGPNHFIFLDCFIYLRSIWFNKSWPPIFCPKFFAIFKHYLRTLRRCCALFWFFGLFLKDVTQIKPHLHCLSLPSHPELTGTMQQACEVMITLSELHTVRTHCFLLTFIQYWSASSAKDFQLNAPHLLRNLTGAVTVREFVNHRETCCKNTSCEFKIVTTRNLRWAEHWKLNYTQNISTLLGY